MSLEYLPRSSTMMYDDVCIQDLTNCQTCWSIPCHIQWFLSSPCLMHLIPRRNSAGPEPLFKGALMILAQRRNKQRSKGNLKCPSYHSEMILKKKAKKHENMKFKKKNSWFQIVSPKDRSNMIQKKKFHPCHQSFQHTPWSGITAASTTAWGENE